MMPKVCRIRKHARPVAVHYNRCRACKLSVDFLKEYQMKEAELFESQGYAVLRNFLEAERTDALAQEVERIHRQWMKENHAAFVEQGLVNMHSLTSPAYFRDAAARSRFFDLLVFPRLVDTVDQMFGKGLYFHNTQLFFNPFENRRLPYWHRDLQYGPVDDAEQAREQNSLCSLHLRMPLVRERGLELIPGSHRRWDSDLEHKVRYERDGHRNSEALPGSVLIDLAPGDVLVFDAQMLHRGNYHLNPQRKALDLCVGKPHPFTSRYLDANVLPTEEELERITSKQWFRVARQVAAEKFRCE